MPPLRTTLIALLLAGSSVAAQDISFTPSQPRNATLLNFDWKFRPGDFNANAPTAVPDESWQMVQLPHDASICGPFTRDGSDGANGWRPRGAGLYQKRFTIPKAARGKKVLVEFQGVYRDAKVWLNGHELAEQLNGYLGFEVDLTPRVVFGGENVLTVTYDNRTRATSRWYTGEGIYRDVWLRIVDPLHVPLHATYIVTRELSSAGAVIDVETEVVNAYGEQRLCRLVTEITAADGSQAAEAVAVAPIGPGQRYTFRQEIDVPNPKAWDLDHPHLYTAVATLRNEDQIVDTYATRFGIRTIRMTPDRGLLLNGKKVVAKGGNLHHDLGCLGTAALKAGYEYHLDQLKAIGCNSVRLSHNPHAPVLLDTCDEKGILVFNEAYDKWTSQFYGGERSFESQWPNDLEAFIRRDRNHPSVYIWSMGNEVLKQLGGHDKKFETPDAAADFGTGLLKRMVDFTHKLDPSRKVTCGLFPARAKGIKEWDHWDDYDTFKNSLPSEMAFAMDVVSWNYTENMFALDHQRFPQLMFIASETASNLEFGNRKPSWLEMDKNYMIGHYYWSAYDYLGESPWPQKSWGRSLIDLSGWVTPLGRYYQSFYSEQPMVHIMVRETDKELLERLEKKDNKRWDWYPMVDHWTWSGRESVALTTFTNCDEVELVLNGKSLGVRKLADSEESRIDWELPYQAGTLKAIARNGRQIVAEHVLKTAGEPVRIRLTSQKESLAADGLDLAYVEAALVDADGVVVPEHGREIRFQVAGSAGNAGVANGNIVSDEPWQADIRKMWYGRCRLVVRSDRKPGSIIVKATSPGLADGQAALEAMTNALP